MDGILIVDKKPGWTSHDVCAFIRSRFQIQKVGHAGTLDPLATGVLIVLVGRATKLSQVYSSCDKEYLGTLKLGLKTSSHDRDGQVLEVRDAGYVTESMVLDTFRLFQGEIEQTPPMVSALKHKGVRLYKLARQGKEVPREKRKVCIYEFRMTKVRLPEIDFFAHVSKGTYLRTLVNDVGEKLGCFATLMDLRRTRCGEFNINDAVSTDELGQMKSDMLGRMLRMGSASYGIRSSQSDQKAVLAASITR